MHLIRLLLSSTLSLASAANLGDVAKNIHGPVDVLFSILILMTAIIGMFLLLSAMFQWRQHRTNPKIVPLVNVIWSTLLGLLCLSFVYLKLKDRPRPVKRNPFMEKVDQVRKKAHWSIE
jgi:hypothetical protein